MAQSSDNRQMKEKVEQSELGPEIQAKDTEGLLEDYVAKLIKQSIYESLPEKVQKLEAEN